MNLRHRLMRRLRNLGLTTSDARAISSRVQRQIDCMGPWGALQYLKKAGDAIIWASTGSGEKPSWVKTRNRYPIIFEEVQNYSLEIQLRISKLARAIRLDEPNQHQVGKVRDAVLAPYSGTEEGIDELTLRLLTEADRLVVTPISWDPTDYPLVGRQFRKVQSVSGQTKTVDKPPLLDSFRILKSMSFLEELPEWEKIFRPLHPDGVRVAVSHMENTVKYVGEIHAAQEGGGKLRMFASPYTAIQCLLAPMHSFFDAWRSRLSTDCTYDQLSGAYWAQTQLKEGRVVHSVDLSTATCRFPLSAQLAMAVRLGLPEAHVRALAKVARGKWKVGNELLPFFQRKYLRWKVGQPLGIRPSMSMFSLAHNLLLMSICHEFSVEPEDTFRVLGDDVVIANDHVAQVYKRIIASCGIPISWNKTHSSSTFAEFAGASITPDVLLRPGKWSPVSHKNWAQLALELKTVLTGEVTIEQRQAQKLLLFRRGLYEPPTDRWTFWLTANSLLDSAVGDSFSFKAQAPFWYYRVMEDFRDVWNSERIPGIPGYRPENPSAMDAVAPYKGLSETVSQIVYVAKDFGHNVPLVVMAFFGYLSVDLEQGNISPERFNTVMEDVASRAMSLLYLPPKASTRSDHKILESCLTVLRTAKEIQMDQLKVG